MIKIFSVDDSDNFLDVIAKFFEPFPEQYELVGRFGAVQDEEGVDDLVETIEAVRPDIVLMDFGFQLVNRPNDFGIELTKRIIELLPDQKVVMLTDDSPFSSDEVYDRVKRSFQAGAIAYLRKDDPHTWLGCIREIAISAKAEFSEPSVIGSQGGKTVPDSILNTMLERLKNANTFQLTDRQVEAIKYLSSDLRIEGVADAMSIKFDTASEHLDNAKIKLNVKTLHGLVAAAMRHGIVL